MRDSSTITEKESPTADATARAGLRRKSTRMSYLSHPLSGFNPEAAGPTQLDLFGAAPIPSTALIGIKATLPNPCPSCGSNVVVMGSSAGAALVATQLRRLQSASWLGIGRKLPVHQ
jgi:hypothetical protein